MAVSIAQNILLWNVSSQNVKGNVAGADIYHQHFPVLHPHCMGNSIGEICEVGTVQCDFIDPKFRFFQQI